MNEVQTESPPVAGDPEAPSAPTVDDPLHKTHYAFRREGENLWVYTWLDPGAHLPEHFHPSLDEYWEAIDGPLRVKLAGEWRDLRPEDGPVHVARNVRHELKNESDLQVRGRTEVKPAARLQEFLEESSWAAREGLYNSRNLPTSWRGLTWLSRFALEHRDHSVAVSPPQPIQRLLLPLFARFAR